MLRCGCFPTLLHHKGVLLSLGYKCMLHMRWSWFSFQVSTIPLCICIRFFTIHSSFNGQLGCFHILATMNRAEMPLDEQVSLQWDTNFPWACTQESCSWVKCSVTFSLWKNFQTHFYNTGPRISQPDFQHSRVDGLQAKPFTVDVLATDSC